MIEIERVSAGENSPGKDFFSVEDRARIAAFHVAKRARQWEAGRIAAKRLAARLTGKEARRVRVEQDHRGVPGFAGLRPSLSISHAGATAVAAADPEGGAVGIDEELIETRPAAWRDLAFSAAEREEMDRNRGGDDEATRRWTEKEAVLKFLGLGLSVDLHSVQRLEGTLRLRGKTLEAWKKEGRPFVRIESRRSPGRWCTVAHRGGVVRWN